MILTPYSLSSLNVDPVCRHHTYRNLIQERLIEKLNQRTAARLAQRNWELELKIATTVAEMLAESMQKEVA